MTNPMSIDVAGYEVALDRRYDPATHLWVALQTPDTVRVGLDPLGRETSGDIVALSLEPVGTRVLRGDPIGSIEAAKFVGPLLAPVSGTVTEHNTDVLVSPGLLNEDPAAHWLVGLELAYRAELDELVGGEAAVARWFAAEVDRFRRQGAIAQ